MNMRRQQWLIAQEDSARAKGLLKTTFILGVMLLLTGCASLAPVAAPVLSTYESGNATVQAQTVVSLSADNFVVTKTNIVGTSKGFSLLGLIPIYPAHLNTAMNRLYAQSGIEPGSAKALANLTIERTSTYWILFSIPETSIRAQVVQFKPGAANTNKLPVMLQTQD
jgi:hypothetical protein